MAIFNICICIGRTERFLLFSHLSLTCSKTLLFLNVSVVNSRLETHILHVMFSTEWRYHGPSKILEKTKDK